MDDGDADGDGDVDGNDFLNWQRNFTPPPEPTGDFDTDGDIDGEDLGIWEGGFGMPTGANLDDGDADGDGDVDGNDFLNWQRNFTGPAAAGAGSSNGSEATDAGGGAFFSTTDAAAGASSDATTEPLAPARTCSNSGNSGQDAPALPTDHHGLSFESVDYAGWSLSQPMPKTNGSTVAWLDLPQFQSRGAYRPFQRDLAVDTVMSRLDAQTQRVDLKRAHATAAIPGWSQIALIPQQKCS